jgi:hypothetical protein
MASMWSGVVAWWLTADGVVSGTRCKISTVCNAMCPCEYLMMAGSEIGGAASTRRSMRCGQVRAVLNATLAPQCHPMTQKYCACAAQEKAVSNGCWHSSGMSEDRCGLYIHTHHTAVSA